MKTDKNVPMVYLIIPFHLKNDQHGKAEPRIPVAQFNFNENGIKSFKLIQIRFLSAEKIKSNIIRL